MNEICLYKCRKSFVQRSFEGAGYGVDSATMFEKALADAVEASLVGSAHDLAALEKHCQVAEDSAALRAQLESRGLVAFIADGSRLPRRSGVDDRPAMGEVVPNTRTP